MCLEHDTIYKYTLVVQLNLILQVVLLFKWLGTNSVRSLSFLLEAHILCLWPQAAVHLSMSASCIWLTGNYMAVTSMALGMNLCWARTLQHSVFHVSNIKEIFSKSNYCYWLKDEWWALCSYYNPQLLWELNVTLCAGRCLCLVHF